MCLDCILEWDQQLIAEGRADECVFQYDEDGKPIVPKPSPLEGLRIVRVRRMTPAEAAWMFWPTDDLPVVLDLSDGSFLLAASDSEGNEPGTFMVVARHPNGDARELRDVPLSPER